MAVAAPLGRPPARQEPRGSGVLSPRTPFDVSNLIVTTEMGR